MPQQLLIGSGQTGGRRRGGASRGNLVGGQYVGGQYPNNLIGAGEYGAGFFDTLGRVAENVIPLVPGIIGAVKGIRGGAHDPNGPYAQFHGALNRDKTLLSGYGQDVEKTIKAVTKLEKDKKISGRNATLIKSRIYDVYTEPLINLENTELYPMQERTSHQLQALIPLFGAINAAETPDAKLAALNGLAAYIGIQPMQITTGQGLRDFQNAIHQQIVNLYDATPENGRAQFLYNLINVGARYFDKKGAAVFVKLSKDSKVQLPGWRNLITTAENNNMFIKPPYQTVYSRKIGKKEPHTVSYYEGPNEQIISAETGKPYSAAYLKQIGESQYPVSVRSLPPGLRAPTAFDLWPQRGPIVGAPQHREFIDEGFEGDDGAADGLDFVDQPGAPAARRGAGYRGGLYRGQKSRTPAGLVGATRGGNFLGDIINSVF